MNLQNTLCCVATLSIQKKKYFLKGSNESKNHIVPSKQLSYFNIDLVNQLAR